MNPNLPRQYYETVLLTERQHLAKLRFKRDAIQEQIDASLKKIQEVRQVIDGNPG